ncbi:cysteinyl-tRNA synthetase, variant 3 [Entomophthora muscae]|uniref:Cysteinyl-tRNA synthetase, variant 3 n=1 Tax=Entomophthora muscae TaxID=34485 RepID=A0ACC2S5A8_9FUNG|nr:cysteinyl-tRNA synthetase, variant 3 [Entomophthora muscae]
MTSFQSGIDDEAIKTLDQALEQFLEEKLKSQDLASAEVKAKLPDADPKVPMHFSAAKIAHEAITDLKAKVAFGETTEPLALSELIEKTRDVVGPYLDKKDGHGVTEHKIFRDLAAFWEKDFLGDMDALNVLPADILTRVSEYVPEVVGFVERIVANGYGYEVDGSVYFDTAAFDAHPNHYYAKLEPNSANNLALIEDGEGSLGAKLTGKKNPSDFALWKKSKAGEPSWDSPWGKGRPGWHIECSAMASEVLGENMDIHSGGEDLAFPHHDNELAQSEAHHSCKQWVNYFFHVGHLHISGQKMSKSLKNFITIKEALARYTARQLRITFLMHQWDNGMDFKDSAMEEAINTEKLFNNFLINAKALIHEARVNPPAFTGKHQYHDSEKQLMAYFTERQTAIHAALCDSFNTPNVIRELGDIVNRANVYIASRRPTGSPVNAEVIAKLAKYVTKILSVFGLTGRGQDLGWQSSGQGEANAEETLMPYLHALSTFRDQIRAIARGSGDAKEILAACDRLRDQELADLGVLLDDREDGRALVKLVDKEELIRERDAKLQREEEKRLKKEAAAKVQEQKLRERLEKGKLAPEDLFKTPEFSKWDAEGIPTHDAAGEEVAKSRRKKLTKDFEAQKKLHAEYLAHTSK